MKYHDFIPLGTELTVNVPTESNKIVECQGKVMWASKMPLTDWYEIGLKFTEDGSGVMTRKKIHEFLESGPLKVKENSERS